MSTYLDTRSGKWFKTREELIAFQRGEGSTPSPLSVSKQKEEKTVKPEATTTEPQQEETEKSESDEEFERMIRDALLVPLEQIKTELKDEFLVDGRRLRWADDDELKQLYLEKLKQRWMRSR